MSSHAVVTAFASFILLATSAGACASAPDPTSSASAAGGESCSDRASSAGSPALAAVDNNRACASDQDCVTVGISSACFDMCTRSVASSGVAAVKAALSDADVQGCKAFVAQGCQKVVPPCMPPAAPVCSNGLCG